MFCKYLGKHGNVNLNGSINVTFVLVEAGNMYSWEHIHELILKLTNGPISHTIFQKVLLQNTKQHLDEWHSSRCIIGFSVIVATHCCPCGVWIHISLSVTLTSTVNTPNTTIPVGI